MKRILLFVIALSVISGGIYAYTQKKNIIEVVNVPGATVTEVREVNPLDAQIAEREKELTEKYDKIKKVEARVDVLKAERDRLDTEIASLQKELASFMTATSSKR